MAWVKIGEGLYQDTVTGAMGVLKKNKGGGLFVASSESYKGTYKKEFGNYEYEKINKKHKAYKANREIENAIREKDNAFGERQRMKRKYGELSEEFKKADDKYKEALDKRDYWYDKRRRLETEDLKYSMDVTMATEKGIDIKPKQLENLKTVGNVTQNTANLENAYIKHKNTRTEMNKVWRADASNELISKDLSAEIDYKTSNNKYSKMYGKEATKDVISRGQEALDRKSLSKDGYKNKEAQDFHFAGEEYKKEIKYQGLKKEGEQELRRLKKENNYKSDKQSVYPSNWNTNDISPMSEYSDTTGTGLSDRQHTALSKMSLSELRKTAKEYNIDTTGLSRQKLMAKLIAIFK